MKILKLIFIDYAFFVGIILLIVKFSFELPVMLWAQTHLNDFMYYGVFSFGIVISGFFLFFYTIFGFFSGVYKLFIRGSGSKNNFTPLKNISTTSKKGLSSFSPHILFIVSLYVNFSLASSVGTAFFINYRPIPNSEDWGGIIISTLSVFILVPILTVMTAFAIWFYNKSKKKIILQILIAYFVLAMIVPQIFFLLNKNSQNLINHSPSSQQY